MTSLIAHNIDGQERTRDVILDENITFESLLLPKNILDGLLQSGFRKPSPIQFKAIPLGRIGFDLIVKSKSGTGKTAVFGLLALEVVDVSLKDLQVLILAPTREIAVQIEEVISTLGQFLKGLKVKSFIGGFPESEDVEKAKNCHIAVGAPGRIKSLVKQQILNPQYIKLFVLDEADKIMETNMQKDINEIFHYLPIRKQVIVSSATYTSELEDFLKLYMNSPCYVNAENETPLLLGLKHFVKEIEDSPTAALEMKNKNFYLLEILNCVSFTQCLIFLNHQTKAQSISSVLNRNGFNSTFISGLQKQEKRLEAIKDLKTFKCRILTSTDLTARGIDAANVDLVINYDIPVDIMTYLHRMGRAGRYGSKGLCVTLACKGKQMQQIQNYLGQLGGSNLTILELPSLSGNAINLFDCDDSTFKKIHALTNNVECEKKLKENILNFKSQKLTKSTEKKDKNTKNQNFIKELKGDIKVQPEELNKDCHMNDEEKNETKLTEIPNETEDTFSILQQLSSGNFDFSKEDTTFKKLPMANVHEEMLIDNNKTEKNSTSDTISILMKLSSGDFSFIDQLTSLEKESVIDTNNDSQIIKNLENTNNQNSVEINNSIKTENKKSEIFCKNVAFYEAAKIISNKTKDLDNTVMEHISKYLNLLKSQDHNSLTNILENISNTAVSHNILNEKNKSDQIVKANESNDKKLHHSEQNTFNLDDIFDLAFNHNLDKNKPHWSECIPDETIHLENLNINEDTSENIHTDEMDTNQSSEKIVDPFTWIPVTSKPPATNFKPVNLLETTTDESEVEEDMEELVAFKTGNNISNFQTNEMEYTVQNKEHSSINNSMNHHFNACFDHCSKQLWENGCNFDSVQKFDEWFRNWRRNVQSVRRYIAQ